MINSQFSQPLWLATYNLSPRRVTKFLLSIIALLVLFNLLERGIVHWLNAQNNGKLISVYFNFDEEGNLPSLYSSLALGFSSYLLAIIASLRKTVKGKYARQWKTLSLIFLYLAIDENCGIHELLIPVFKELINAKGLLYFPWVVPAFCLIVVFLIIYRKFILALPRQTKVMFLLSGTIYILVL
ncbi:MAG: peptidase M48 Ste24p [Hyellaceae cyanobacterium CSU_1_1]|nr:peptidase M48 Ste24p [Hyellaceae cyanobacterium CSU_1_1]